MNASLCAAAISAPAVSPTQLTSNSVIEPIITASISNASGQLFPNTSSTSPSDFSYIIPYDQTENCNIYGPICQTGSITVGLNRTTAIPTTVVPCSSYLSAQSTYLNNFVSADGDPFFSGEWFGYPELEDWGISFGRSPECRSYANALKKGQYTFSGCGSSNKVVPTDGSYSSQFPPGIVRHFPPHPEDGTCCGDCSLDIPEVRIYYFPDKTNNCHHNQTSNVTSTLPARNLEKRIHSLIVDGSTAVVSGHTL